PLQKITHGLRDTENAPQRHRDMALCELDFVRFRQARRLLRPRTFASGATRAAVGTWRRSAEIRGRSRTCRIRPTCRGAARSRAVEQFADAAVFWPVFNYLTKSN